VTDGCRTSYSPERYARSVEVVRGEADRLGRDLDGFTWSAYVFVSLDDDATRAEAAAIEFLGGTYRSDFRAMVHRVACVGNADQVTERLAAFVDAGVEEFVLAPVGPARGDTAVRLLEEIRPRLVDA
jgi:alkanesulfonate monooxygenase SsuD/methylene tetrahydromethanopterin reductase-like flavin-dependent oxidoreductase (luciferase family)